MGVPFFGPLMLKLFGSRNQRLVKRYLKLVDQINTHEPQMRVLTDPQLRELAAKFRSRLAAGEKSADLMPEIFALGREAMDRSVGIRNILNPDHKFDPARLPADARAMYDQVKATADAMEPAQPTGDLRGHSGTLPGWMLVDIPPALYEAVRELYPESKPPFRARPFDVQLIGAMVLGDGNIAEMKTGEGKTIVGPLAALLACLEGMQVHVITVNDYLVQRDRDWTFPFFRAVGLTVGAIHPMHMQSPPQKAEAYSCDVVYGTTAEFGFDYLRDNMKLRVEEQVQKRREFAIVDEVDSILIDEARTPLIISGLAHATRPRYDLADRIARHLVEKQREWDRANAKVESCNVEISGLEGDIRNARDAAKVPEMKRRLEEARRELPGYEAERDRHVQFYEVELDKKKANLTHEGIAEAQRNAGMGSFYVGENIDLPHLLEQAIRAHVVYQRDRDYVVAQDDDGQMGVVIVDQNTGRKMVGRQWSDGLHQAVEAKEGVRIKDETQTMATITIQNYFKLYKRLAGMTGTADTEATEFHEIYRLDVVAIPTNVPVVRVDRNDLVFIAAKDKWEAIVDEIRAMHDFGRPVLVGTTSVEKSELVSKLLTQRHSIRHEVLNAKQHDREADIVLGAGQLGAVMIATNMAGRGTDIKLGKATREQMVEHWKKRGICPKELDASAADDSVSAAIMRHIAPRELELPKSEIEKMSDAEVRLAMLRHWAVTYCWADARQAEKANEGDLVATLDAAGFSLHRVGFYDTVEEMGGLHIIGTERHESRRIDNQLRGRAGRQGDKGSSRFFLSLEDDLMKMFAGKGTLGLLSRLGMKEGDAIEHPMLSRAVAKAQRKVEERNFQIRKNILEYDEPMEHQRQRFYGLRQQVLEGRGIGDLIFGYLEESTADAAATHLDPLHRARAIAEWVRENVNITLDPTRIKNKDREDLREAILIDAREDAASAIRVTIGEYIFDDAPPEEWDTPGLCDWARVTFGAELDPEHVRTMSENEIAAAIEDGARKRIASIDLTPLDRYFAPLYAEGELARWAQSKFGGEFDASMFESVEDRNDAVRRILDRARAMYREREMAYPIEFAIEMTAAMLQQDARAAIAQFCGWVRARYELDWNPDALPSPNPAELRNILLEEARKWDDARIAERSRKALATGRDAEAIDRWFRSECNIALTDAEREEAQADPNAFVPKRLRELMRSELTQFERWALLQILDTSWKDHLHSMDQIREAIGFRAFSQRDPRIEFKREAARLFDEMQDSVRDKVTDVVLKGRLSPQMAQQAPQAPVGQPGAGGAGGAEGGPGAPGAGNAGQPGTQPAQRPAPRPVTAAQPAISAASKMISGMGAGGGAGHGGVGGAGPSGGAMPTEQRGSVATVGRNEPCPCGSGRKYKRCCGKRGED